MNELEKRGLAIEKRFRGLDAFELSVPGNILLMGEYAVLEEDGRGLALAVERRATLRCGYSGAPESVFSEDYSQKTAPAPAENPVSLPAQTMAENSAPHPAQAPVQGPELIFEFRTFGKTEIFRIRNNITDPSGSPQQAPVIVAVLQALKQETAGRGLMLEARGNWRCVVDTSAFFDADGRKLGLGSSAAACLLLTVALAHLFTVGNLEKSNTQPVRKAVFKNIARIAVKAHRIFQGGRGSGYDVVCSFLGGANLFRGGIRPRAQSLPELAKQIPDFRLYEGPQPVRTISAIDAYRRARTGEPARVRAYVASCEDRSRRVLRARTWRQLATILAEARSDGILFGELIGVSAAIDAPAQRATETPGDVFFKALGAGNETGIVFMTDQPETAGRSNVGLVHSAKRPAYFAERVAREGLTVSDLYQGEAYGKLLLFGEHAAVYGHPACGLTLEAKSVMRFVRNDDKQNAAKTPDETMPAEFFPGLAPKVAGQASAALRVALGVFPALRLPGGHFEYSSTVPESGGFGSSAAVSVALTRTLAGIAGEPLSDTELWRRANTVDSHFHGKASGIDTGLAMRHGLWALDARNLAARAIQCRPALFYIVYAALPRSAGTKTFVGDIRTRIDAGDTETKNNIDKLGKIAEKAISILENGNTLGNDGTVGDPPNDDRRAIAALGHLARNAGRVLEDLDLSTETLDFMIQSALDAGSPGAKLSGAGGGGAFYAWAADKNHAEVLRRTLCKRAKDGNVDLACEPTILCLTPGETRFRA